MQTGSRIDHDWKSWEKINRYLLSRLRILAQGAGRRSPGRQRKDESKEKIDQVMNVLRQMGLKSEHIEQTARSANFLNTQGWRPDQVAQQIQQLIDEGKLQGLAGEHIHLYAQQLLQQMMGDDEAGNSGAWHGNSRLSINPPQGAGIPAGNPPQAINSPAGTGYQSVTPADESPIRREFPPALQEQVARPGFRQMGVRPGDWPGLEVTGLSLRMGADGRLSSGSRAQVSALINNLSKQFGGRQIYANVYRTEEDAILLHVAAGLPLSGNYYSLLDTIYRSQTESPGFTSKLRDAEPPAQMYAPQDEFIDWYNTMVDYGIYDIN